MTTQELLEAPVIKIEKQKLLVVDGSYIVHKSYHRALELIPAEEVEKNNYALTAKSYEIALQTMSLLLEDLNAVGAFVVLDLPSEGKMVNCLKHYEEDKNEKYEYINEIKNLLVKYLPEIGINAVGVFGIEADTVAYCIANLSEEELKELFQVNAEQVELYLVTADTDWEISISKNASLYNPLSKSFASELDMVRWCGHKDYRNSFISHRCLTSNKDGIYGVHGVGGKGSDHIRDLLHSNGMPSKPEIEGTSGRTKSNLKKVLENWSIFCSNWEVVRQDWIYERTYFNGEKLCSEVIMKILQESRKNLDSQLKTEGRRDLALGMVSNPAGSSAKLRPARNRFSNFILRRSSYVL